MNREDSNKPTHYILYFKNRYKESLIASMQDKYNKILERYTEKIYSGDIIFNLVVLEEPIKYTNEEIKYFEVEDTNLIQESV